MLWTGSSLDSVRFGLSRVFLSRGDRFQAVDVTELSPCAGAAQVSSPVFAQTKTKPGPKGPTADLIRAVVEMKQRNPTWGCPYIAAQINLAFGTAINKDVVRRILA